MSAAGRAGGAESAGSAEDVGRRAGDTDYESTGTGYERHRRPDPRIASLILERLGDARSVLNVGAGAGSYEPTDRHVVAVEPSAAMRARRRLTAAVPAIDASASRLPFDDDALDAAMAIFTVHQWPDPAAGLAEVRRVCSGPVVVMTLDIEALDGFWLADYLPERLAVERERFPSLSLVADALGGRVDVFRVPIPLECSDGFLEAYYGRPESLLDPQVRAAQSGWNFVDPQVAQAGLDRLAADLGSGAWDARYGRLRHQPTYAGPLVLVTSRP